MTKQIVEIDKKLIHMSIYTAIIIVITLIGFVAGAVSWKANIENEIGLHRTEQFSINSELDDRITHVGEKVVSMRVDIEALKEQANGRDIQLATINTKLANIEVTVLEIKQMLQNTQ